MAEFVTLDRYFTSQEAHLIRNKLEASGIECVILNELSTQIYNFHAPTNGGIILKVRSEDLDTAREIANNTFDELQLDEEFEVGTQETENPVREASGSKNSSSLALLLFGLMLLIALAYLFAGQFMR